MAQYGRTHACHGSRLAKLDSTSAVDVVPRRNRCLVFDGDATARWNVGRIDQHGRRGDPVPLTDRSTRTEFHRSEVPKNIQVTDPGTRSHADVLHVVEERDS